MIVRLHSPQIGILRSSTGNIGSIERSLQRLGIASCVVGTAAEIGKTDGLIFPGAGAALPVMNDLKDRCLVEVLRNYSKPFLGICLGMQLLFDTSEEGPADCLGIIRGKVVELPGTVRKPHMGWNRLSTGEYAYFVHSFVCAPTDSRVITITVQHGIEIVAAVRKENFFGLQWHPEKSGETGDRFLSFFVRLCK
ncbi:MAG: imidazole glycerol phosphate synthase subunit HisH [Candidatus Peribacteraceae bacterium]|nr:imidazole glycerol phosphate synthase subunit HisH [Candidatus Peribacteraceae bacterium]MDD5742080.1 imidazole glycerol phosphate synthase subunit HisH [Candidatus Peribacteraceae bacterium]